MLDGLLVQILRDETRNFLVALLVNIERRKLSAIWYIDYAVVLLFNWLAGTVT